MAAGPFKLGAVTALIGGREAESGGEALDLKAPGGVLHKRVDDELEGPPASWIRSVPTSVGPPEA